MAQNNVINNYKGVMLCNRPNQPNSGPSAPKPFCGRVIPPDQIGLVPFPKPPGEKPEAKPMNKNSILLRHKKWLQDFKEHVTHKHQELEEIKKKEEDKFKKVREIGQNDRDRARKMKNQYNQTASNVMNVLEQKPAAQLTADNLNKLNNINEESQPFKKKSKGQQKPMWAYTEKELEDKEDKQVDDLLNFFETTPLEQYSEDQQVKRIMHNLKQKIDKLKEQENWKEKEVERIAEKKRSRQERAEKGDNDAYSNFSVQSEGGKSVASEKSQKKIEQLRQKKQQKEEWDKLTEKESVHSNTEERIAKNIADQVLRNYPNLKGVHSNTSIRRLLQAQASKALNQPISRPVITTVVHEKQPINANNLPYLHRNPAI